MNKQAKLLKLKAINYEETEVWHIVFSNKEPKARQKFKCKTYSVPYRILIKTTIKTNALVQKFEPGFYLISNPFETFHFCINPQKYLEQKNYIGFISEAPKTKTNPNISVIFIRDGKPCEAPHFVDKITNVYFLNKSLYHVTTENNFNYFLFIREEKVQT